MHFPGTLCRTFGFYAAAASCSLARMEILIRESQEAGCLLGARIIAKLVREKPAAVLGLATGRTPLRLYQELIRLHREESLDFSRITTFNLDEYVGLPATHPQSYRWFMDEHFFRHINIDRRQTHVPDGTAADLHAECRAYERKIADAGGIDLQLLGLGRNGHIGFNEPTGSLRSRTWIKILSEQTLRDNSEVFGSLEAMPRHAITMGVGTILECRRCLLLATGREKAQVIAKAVEGPVTSMISASALQLHPRCSVIVDEEAATCLENQEYYRWIFDNEPEWQEFRKV